MFGNYQYRVTFEIIWLAIENLSVVSGLSTGLSLSPSNKHVNITSSVQTLNIGEWSIVAPTGFTSSTLLGERSPKSTLEISPSSQPSITIKKNEQLNSSLEPIPKFTLTLTASKATPMTEHQKMFSYTSLSSKISSVSLSIPPGSMSGEMISSPNILQDPSSSFLPISPSPERLPTITTTTSVSVFSQRQSIQTDSISPSSSRATPRLKTFTLHIGPNDVSIVAASLCAAYILMNLTKVDNLTNMTTYHTNSSQVVLFSRCQTNVTQEFNRPSSKKKKGKTSREMASLVFSMASFVLQIIFFLYVLVLNQREKTKVNELEKKHWSEKKSEDEEEDEISNVL